MNFSFFNFLPLFSRSRVLTLVFPVYCCVSQVRISDSWSDRLIRASLHGCLDRRRRETQEMSYRARLAGLATPAGLQPQVHSWWEGGVGGTPGPGEICHEEGRWVHIY